MAIMDQIKSVTSLGKKVAGVGETVVVPTPKSKFDKYMNKINRLPRIMMLFGIIAMIVHAGTDPVHYTLWMQALAETPAELWYIFTLVIVSWAGTKFVRDVKMPSDSKVIQLNTGPVVNAGDVITGSERTFDNLEHDDHDIVELPPENSAIEEWKKKNGN